MKLPPLVSTWPNMAISGIYYVNNGDKLWQTRFGLSHRIRQNLPTWFGDQTSLFGWLSHDKINETLLMLNEK